MKNKINKGAFHLMLALCTMGSLTACSSDDALSNTEETADAVKIAVSTRSSEGSPWTADDAITLLANDDQTATYQWDGNAWSSKDVLCWPNGVTTLDFMGYYPTSATNNGLSFSIPTDQSDEAKLHAADYMTTDCQYGVVKSNDATVDFDFKHRLAKVVMNISFRTEFGETPTFSSESIYSQGSGVTVTKNTANGETSSVTSTGSAVSIQPLKTTNAENLPSYTALVSPTKLTNGNTFMTIYVNGKMVQSIFNGADLDLESGKAYNFNVTIGNNKVILESFTIGAWQTVTGGTGNLDL